LFKRRANIFIFFAPFSFSSPGSSCSGGCASEQIRCAGGIMGGSTLELRHARTRTTQMPPLRSVVHTRSPQSLPPAILPGTGLQEGQQDRQPTSLAPLAQGP
jgi:hypothetical protein